MWQKRKKPLKRDSRISPKKSVKKQKSPKAKKSLRNKLDKIFSEVIRSFGKCERCGSTNQLQCAHIYSRRYVHTRWDTLNALCLCAGCHFWAHQNPIDFTRFVDKKLGEGTTDELRVKAHSLSPVSLEDMQEIYESLKIQL